MASSNEKAIGLKNSYVAGLIEGGALKGAPQMPEKDMGNIASVSVNFDTGYTTQKNDGDDTLYITGNGRTIKKSFDDGRPGFAQGYANPVHSHLNSSGEIYSRNLDVASSRSGDDMMSYAESFMPKIPRSQTRKDIPINYSKNYSDSYIKEDVNSVYTGGPEAAKDSNGNYTGGYDGPGEVEEMRRKNRRQNVQQNVQRQQLLHHLTRPRQVMPSAMGGFTIY